MSAASIAALVDCSLQGDGGLLVHHVAPFSELADGAISFSNQSLVTLEKAALVVAPACERPLHGAVLTAQKPRHLFAILLRALLQNDLLTLHVADPDIHPTARIHPSAIIGKGAKIGANSIIYPHVVIGEGVVIGEECVIKSATIIGDPGFGFVRDAEGIPHHIPHLASVRIGNRVELGSLNTVCRGTLSDTVIEDDVKTDDHVHIAHNCYLERAAMLAAGAVLSGGVRVCANAWIGPNASVMQKTEIGMHAFVALGANVTKSVAARAVMVGNPARKIADEDGHHDAIT
jgi:UDP-3-O-[3-hydroxymyristoyl] glucosamine N-acyltransferase